ncbi:MAG: class I SAM-dependent methyltransferase [Betaproteobacteria bacterium]|nr:class I SAM-dependent methyltransferase [Betaproteobacteria bacterium]
MRVLSELIESTLGVPTARDYTEQIINNEPECLLALDIGCGSYSHLSGFRPRITTVGIDAFPAAIELAKANNVHDHYIVADVLRFNPIEILSRFERKFDLVTLYGVIEHFPKRAGYELLEKCEELTSKFILLETPNGFVEQGPEYENQFQRHLSGWFPHDFEGLGYKVFGTTGTKYLRGYAALPKYRIKGLGALDFALARLLRANRQAIHAFNLVAVKDMRGVPARLG